MSYDPRIKLYAFQEQTTYKNDYKKYENLTRKKDTWAQDRSEPPLPLSPPEKKQDHETFQNLREGVHVPFNLLWEPKPITGTTPYKSIKMPEKPVDKGKEESMRTRPRLYISPAVSMDDIPDPEMRELMCQYMYTTDWKRAAKEAAPVVKNIPAPEKMEIQSGDPVKLDVDLFPPLPDGWRQNGKEWDRFQTRACVDPTESFWLEKGPQVQCGACKDPLKLLVPEEIKEEIAQLIEKEQLRLPHDRPKPDYTGYQPCMSQGVTLKKIEQPVTHPSLSVSQAITRRYAEDSIQ